MSKETIKTKGITVIIQNSNIADRIFKKSDQNKCAKEAMMAVVNFWGSVFLPQRFDKNNAKYGAHVSRQWDQTKRRMLDNNSGTKDGRSPVAPQPQDLVFTGKMRKAVLGSWRPSAVSTNVKPRGRVAMPTDHAIKANISRVLKHVPAFEYARLEEVFKAAFNKAIVEGEARQAAKKQAKADIKTAKKAATKARREARTAAKKADRKSVRKLRSGIKGNPRQSIGS